MISDLKIKDWKQFDTVELNFHPNLTIIAGANGSGKSTILRIISRAIGWDYEEVAKFQEITGGEKNADISNYDYMDKFSSSVNFNKKIEEALNNIKKKTNTDKNIEMEDSEASKVGDITMDGNIYGVYVPEADLSATYSIDIYKIVKVTDENESYNEYRWPEVEGVFITSHRMPYIYTSIDYISSKVLEKESYYNQYKDEFINRQLYRYNEPNPTSPFSVLKNSLVAYSLHQKNNGPKVMDEFVHILKKILPDEFGLVDIEVRNGEVILKTEHTDILLDSVSGGISSIIDIVWQVFMTEKPAPFIVIDEIENHLHPSMQRRILPDLIKAFPNIQFIISTHSPFVINSVSDCHLYVLQKNINGYIESTQLDIENHLTDAVDVLKDVLGVSVILPIWREQELNSIMNKHTGKYLNKQVLMELKSDLSRIGMEDYLSDALESFEYGENTDD